jgi:hypothetical protein
MGQQVKVSETMLDGSSIRGSTAVSASDQSVSCVKLKAVSTGITVSRLASGTFAISAHEGEHRTIVELSRDELRAFASHAAGLAE